MTKQRIAALILAALGIFSLAFCALAKNQDNAYDGFDEYNAFEDTGNYEQAVERVPQPRPWYTRISIVPAVIGVIIGAAFVAILYKTTAAEPLPKPIKEEPMFSCRLLEQRDIPRN